MAHKEKKRNNYIFIKATETHSSMRWEHAKQQKATAVAKPDDNMAVLCW